MRRNENGLAAGPRASAQGRRKPSSKIPQRRHRPLRTSAPQNATAPKADGSEAAGSDADRPKPLAKADEAESRLAHRAAAASGSVRPDGASSNVTRTFDLQHGSGAIYALRPPPYALFLPAAKALPLRAVFFRSARTSFSAAPSI